MTEIHLDCPHCQRQIVVKVQSEIYAEPSGYETIAPYRQFRQIVDKVIVKLHDGTEREVTNLDELQAIFKGIDIRQVIKESSFEDYTDERLDQRIKMVEDGIERHKRLYSDLLKQDQTRFIDNVIAPLEKHLQLLREEKKKRKQ